MGRLVQSVIMVLLFTVIATTALMFAMGYRVNRAAGTIERTGIIEIDTKYPIAADVYLNGQLQQNGVPLRKGWVFPGQYTVRVEKEGYQTWSRILQVRPNQRSQFRAIILIYREPKTVELPVLRQDDFLPTRSDTEGVEVRFDNELWVKDEFLTRTSEDMYGARWFSGREHIVYQVGQRIVMSEVDGFNTQVLAELQEEGPAPFTFREGGRILIYQDGEETHAVQLFEEWSFIDRLGVARSRSQQ